MGCVACIHMWHFHWVITCVCNTLVVARSNGETTCLGWLRRQGLSLWRRGGQRLRVTAKQCTDAKSKKGGILRRRIHGILCFTRAFDEPAEQAQAAATRTAIERCAR